MATGLAVFAVGVAVRLLDDLLDGRPGESLPGTASAPAVYAAALVALGAGLAPGVAVSLFLSAYAVGMLADPAERLPPGAPAWVESLLAVGLAVALVGPLETAGSLLLMLGIQALDDGVDLPRDRAEGRRSIATAVGRWPAFFLGAVCFSAALTFATAKALAV